MARVETGYTLTVTLLKFDSQNRLHNGQKCHTSGMFGCHCNLKFTKICVDTLPMGLVIGAIFWRA